MSKITLITVTYNSSGVINDFVNSLINQSFFDWELYVVDSCSSDDTIKKITDYHEKRILLLPQKENVGFAKGCNIGIIEAINNQGDFVLLINNDTVFDSELLKILHDEIIKYKVDMIAPKVMFFDEKNKIQYAGGGFNKIQAMKNYNVGEGCIDVGQFDKLREVDFAPMCCVLFRTGVFVDTSVGLLDEDFFVYFEDADWMFRAKQKGVRLLYTPNTKIYHKVSSLTGGFTRSVVGYFFQNRIYYVRKNFKGCYLLWSIFYIIGITSLKILFNIFPRKYGVKVWCSMFKALKKDLNHSLSNKIS